MDVFNHSNGGQKNKIISYINISNENIKQDVEMLKYEIFTIHSKIATIENYIEQNNKTLSDIQNHISSLRYDLALEVIEKKLEGQDTSIDMLFNLYNNNERES